MCIPELCGPCFARLALRICAPRQDSVVVRAEGYGKDPAAVFQCLAELARGNIPNLRLPIPATRDHGLPVETKGDSHDRPQMRERLPDRLPRGHIPEPAFAFLLLRVAASG